MYDASIKLLHNAFITAETSASHSALVNDYDSSSKAYNGLITVETSAAHSNVKVSGYVYTTALNARKTSLLIAC